MKGSSIADALERVTRVPQVRGAMLVSAEDGLVVAETLMEGVKSNAVAALAASLVARLGRTADASGLGPLGFVHLAADRGALLVVPGPPGLLVVVVAAPEVNVGLARLEMRAAAEVAP